MPTLAFSSDPVWSATAAILALVMIGMWALMREILVSVAVVKLLEINRSERIRKVFFGSGDFAGIWVQLIYDPSETASKKSAIDPTESTVHRIDACVCRHRCARRPRGKILRLYSVRPGDPDANPQPASDGPPVRTLRWEYVFRGHVAGGMLNAHYRSKTGRGSNGVLSLASTSRQDAVGRYMRAREGANPLPLDTFVMRWVFVSSDKLSEILTKGHVRYASLPARSDIEPVGGWPRWAGRVYEDVRKALAADSATIEG